MHRLSSTVMVGSGHAKLSAWPLDVAHTLYLRRTGSRMLQDPRGQPGLGPGPCLVAVAEEAAVLATAEAPGERGLRISRMGPLLHLLRGFYVSGPEFDRNSSYAQLEVGRNAGFS